MVRNYTPRSARKVTSPRKLKAALESVLREGWKVRAAAKHHNVNRQTLWKTVKKAKENPHEEPKGQFTFANRSVFTKEIEECIAAYCRDVAEMGYGLSVQCVRELAFEVASKNRIDMPQNWKEHKLAGIDWFYGFMKRNPNLSIRVPEACSIARAMAFNQPTVERYFEKLEKVISTHESFKNGSHVDNLDETCTSTVQNVTKVISPKGTKQVHQIKGAERGVSVTTAVIIGANGTLLPPVMIFPRKKFVSSLIINAFPGTLGLANEKGYMTKETFVYVIEHFIKHTQAS